MGECETGRNRRTDTPLGRQVWRIWWAFESAAYATEVDGVSNIVRTRFGYHLIKIEDKRILENAIDLEKEKNKLLKSEKDKKLRMYALSHFNKIKQSIAIDYNIQWLEHWQ